MDELFEALAWCEQKSAREERKYRDDFFRASGGWKLEPDDTEFLRLITSAKISGRALLSNVNVRRVAQEALIKALLLEFQKSSNRQWLWITVACDFGVSSEREPLIDTVALCNRFYRHLQRRQLEGFGVLETDIWKLIAGEPGRRMVTHLHFAGHSDDGLVIDVGALEQELGCRRALTNSLPAPPVDVQEISSTALDFARVGRYMLKPPAFAKNPVPRKDGTFRLRDVAHVRGSVARLVEIQSRLEVGDVTFSIGKGSGKSIADAVRTAAAHEVRERPGSKSAPSREEVDQHWRRIRLVNGSPLLREPVVITRKWQRDMLEN